MRIDSDAHVIESVHTWDYLSADEEKYRPQPITEDSGDKKFWLLEGKAHPRAVGNRNISLDIREGIDIDGRIAEMDSLDIDVQVLFPTMFLQGQLSEHVEGRIALCRSYNRWLGEISDKSKGRLAWAVIPPLVDIASSLDEIRWGKEHGAVGIFTRGIEDDMLIDDPRLDPVYQLCSDLNMAICVHAGNGSDALMNTLYRRDLYFFGITPILASFNRLMISTLTARFPDLRFGFLEAGSMWVPYLLREAERRFNTIGIAGTFTSLDTMMTSKNTWVAVRNGDDIPYVMSHSGKSQLLIGTDYGHADPASELGALDALAQQQGVTADDVEHIVGANAMAYFGLEA